MTIKWAAFLGFIQGVAEFLPISSSGHLSVIQNIFGGETTEGHMMFDVLLHLGTLVAVFVAYRSDIAEIITETLDFFRGSPQDTDENGVQVKRRFFAVRLVIMLFFATLPLVIALVVNDYLEQLYYMTGFIGAILILTGVMLYSSDRMEQGRKTEKNMTVTDALFIGLLQVVATIPGLSRSGTTITAGIVRGLKRDFAVKFSFLLSIPAVLGANIITLIKAIGDGVDAALIPAYLVGMLVAGVSGYAAIGLIRWLAKRSGFGFFAWYCWIAGLTTIILSIVL